MPIHPMLLERPVSTRLQAIVCPAKTCGVSWRIHTCLFVPSPALPVNRQVGYGTFSPTMYRHGPDVLTVLCGLHYVRCRMSSNSKSAVIQEFFAWADRHLSQPVPSTTAAFHINLYEGEDSVHVQIIGTESFTPGEDAETDYWPGAETFTTGEDVFEIPFAVAGSDWREWLNVSMDMVNSYIANGAQSSVLRSSSGVGIGFVDGGMYVLWQQADA